MDNSPIIKPRDQALFGQRNLILTGTNNRYHTPPFSGPIAIKAVSFGEVEWRTDERSYRIRPDVLLLLPDGERYTMTMDGPRMSRTFCPVFRRGLVEDSWRVAVSSHEQLLDQPEGLSTVDFSRRLEARSGKLGKALDALAALAGSGSVDGLGWQFETLGAAAADSILEQREKSVA